LKIAILDDYQSVSEEMADWSTLPHGTQVERFSDHLEDEDRLVERLQDFQIVMGMRERTPFPRSLLERLPELRLLITTGGGNASFDTVAATELGIICCGTSGQGEGPTELTWGLIIGLLRQIPQEFEAAKNGIWGSYVGVGLKGKTLGLLGLGHIGSLVARVGNAFDMNVIAWSQNLTKERAQECQATCVTKETLFTDSDIVSIHVRLSDRTRGLVAAQELDMMKSSSYLINISRGPIVVEQDLIEALKAGSIAGAGLDTFDIEPLNPDHPLLTQPNVLSTPHIGYVTREGYQAFYSGVVEDINGYLGGEPIRVINPDVLHSPTLRKS